MKTLLITIAALFLLPLGALAGPRVVASVVPVYVFALNVAGQRAEVSLLVPPGTDVHEFSLRPRDVVRLKGADLVLLQGAGLEAHITRGLRGLKTLDTTGEIVIIEAGGVPDPHTWLDPVLATKQVMAIARALSGLDPGGEAEYMANARQYAARLAALHARLGSRLSGLSGTFLVTYHESFNYFARRYGLKPLSLTGLRAETPLPARLRQVYDIVSREGLAAVFREEQFQPDVLSRLASDLGVKACALDSVMSGQPDSGYYERAMNKNLESITRCLGNK